MSNLQTKLPRRTIIFSLMGGVVLSACRPVAETEIHGSYTYDDGRFLQTIKIASSGMYYYSIVRAAGGDSSLFTGKWSVDNTANVTRLFLEDFDIVVSESDLSRSQERNGTHISAPAVIVGLFGKTQLVFDPNIPIEFEKSR